MKRHHKFLTGALLLLATAAVLVTISEATNLKGLLVSKTDNMRPAAPVQTVNPECTKFSAQLSNAVAENDAAKTSDLYEKVRSNACSVEVAVATQAESLVKVDAEKVELSLVAEPALGAVSQKDRADKVALVSVKMTNKTGSAVKVTGVNFSDKGFHASGLKYTLSAVSANSPEELNVDSSSLSFKAGFEVQPGTSTTVTLFVENDGKLEAGNVFNLTLESLKGVDSGKVRFGTVMLK